MWSRFIYWLGQGQNAGAVQAIAALSAVALTVVLIIITAVYAYFTWRLLRTSREGLKATVRPQFTATLTTEMVDENSMDVVTSIQNVGNMSFTVRLVMVHVECAYALVEQDTGRINISCQARLNVFSHLRRKRRLLTERASLRGFIIMGRRRTQTTRARLSTAL